MRVEQRFDNEDFEELTRYKMCTAIVLSYSQEEVHRISGSSTKKNSIRAGACSRVRVHF